MNELPAWLVSAASVLAAALLGLFQGTRTVNNPQPTRACVTFAGTKPASLITTRFYGVRLSEKAQALLGFSPVTEWEYVAMEVQSEGTESASRTLLNRLDMNADVTGEVEQRGTAAFPNCQIAAVRIDDPLFPSRCACSTGSNCNWTPPQEDGSLGAAVPLPKGLTAPEGTWSGAGCKRKPCVELLGVSSMPPACQP